MTALFLKNFKKLTGTVFIFVLFAVCFSFSTQAAMSGQEIKAALPSYSDMITSTSEDSVNIEYSEWNLSQEEMYYVISDIAETLMGEPIEDYCKVSIRFYYANGPYGKDFETFANNLFEFKKGIGAFWTEWGRYNNMTMVVSSHNNDEKFSANITLQFNGSTGNWGEKYNEKLISIIQEAQSKTTNDMELVQYFLKWLDENAVYRYYTGFTNDPYFALILGRTVCGGYANAFKDLCNAVGIPALVPTSESLNHAWSQVYVNGKWYTADLCDVVRSKSETYNGYLFRDPNVELDCKDFVEKHKSEYIESFDHSDTVNISSCTFSYDNSHEYTGNTITPTVKVTYKGNTLMEGTHYTLNYSSNTLPGTGTVTVSGKNNNGYRGSQTLNFKITLPKPGKLKATPKNTSVTLNWNKVKGATGYIIRFYNKTTKAYDELARVEGNSCIVKDLTPGRKYTFSIKAYVDASGKEYLSSHAKVSVITKPDKVKGLSATSVKSTTLKLKWKAETSATKYQVYISTDKKTWTKTAETAKTAYTVKNLKANKKYYFKVRAVNTSGAGSFSSQKTVQTLLASPKIKLSAGNKKLAVKWNKVSAADGYVVYYSTKSNMSACEKITVKGTDTKLTSLKKKTKYYVRVKAYKVVNGERVYGQYSAIAAKTTK